MDLTWLILGDAFILLVLVWLPVLTFAPLDWANSFWLVGAIYMITATGISITEYGPIHPETTLIIGQLIAYTLMAAIIFARDHTDPDSDLGAADRLTNIAAYLSQLLEDTQTHGQQPSQRPRQHQPPWQRSNSQQQPEQRQEQEHTGTTPPDEPADQYSRIEDLVDEIDDYRNP